MSEQDQAREHAAAWRQRAAELERRARLLRFAGDPASAEELEGAAIDYYADAAWLELEISVFAESGGSVFTTGELDGPAAA